ncbi:MAG: lysophospholipid acyltransferase family protein [Desulfobacteraceae bacterium]|jgi:1-acyl-sn-glycerol-3-phosphate acyltransferase|nr:lysophospholipid acyltransferase family protein [Desulfobacteraceae bacterium]
MTHRSPSPEHRDARRAAAFPASLLLWTVGGLHFVWTFALIAAALTLSDGRRVFPLVRRLMRLQLALMGIRLRVEGAEHLDTARPYLYLGNHQSLFDLMALPAALPAHAVGVEADDHFRIPLWGHLIRRWGNIPIDRTRRQSAIASLEAARSALAGGTSMVILPEGHRTRSGAIGPFKSGPFHLALRARVDIVPFVIEGLFAYNPKGDWRLRPGPARLAFGRPIPPDNYGKDSIEALKVRVRNAMAAIGKEVP